MHDTHTHDDRRTLTAHVLTTRTVETRIAGDSRRPSASQLVVFGGFHLEASGAFAGSPMTSSVDRWSAYMR